MKPYDEWTQEESESVIPPELTDYEKFDLALKRIENMDMPERIKNQMRLGAIRAYEKTKRTGECIKNIKEAEGV